MTNDHTRGTSVLQKAYPGRKAPLKTMLKRKVVKKHKPAGGPIGRPMKYKVLIELLDDDQLYSPGAIASFAVNSGYIEESSPEQVKVEKRRIRIALVQFVRNHGFPTTGDGLIKVKGQALTVGYYGKRWKEAVRPPNGVKSVDPSWDGNKILAQKGLFLLSDVVGSLPFSAAQIRYMAGRCDIGVYKDPDMRAYVVEMDRFSDWVRRIWRDGGR
jgi:hypothetical protein